ncbi:hypothetical protein [Streptomyces sp. NPDC057403]|uniref:hypothetical protein n=1 Tax=Streptomyces sp. NPDC057403 TaxID=3346119 RepID=UPI00369ABA2D
MFTRTLRTITDQLADIMDHVGGLDRRLEKLEVIALVREPASATSADAYDGLRKQVVASATARWTQLAQLAQLDAALAQGADREVVGSLVEVWIAQAALDRVTDGCHPEVNLLFELVEDLGGALEVLEPAYVDRLTGRVVRQGRARRTNPSLAKPEGESERPPSPETSESNETQQAPEALVTGPAAEYHAKVRPNRPAGEGKVTRHDR